MKRIISKTQFNSLNKFKSCNMISSTSCLKHSSHSFSKGFFNSSVPTFSFSSNINTKILDLSNTPSYTSTVRLYFNILLVLR